MVMLSYRITVVQEWALYLHFTTIQTWWYVQYIYTYYIYMINIDKPANYWMSYSFLISQRNDSKPPGPMCKTLPGRIFHGIFHCHFGQISGWLKWPRFGHRSWEPALGTWCLVVELAISLCFPIPKFYWWSHLTFILGKWLKPPTERVFARLFNLSTLYLLDFVGTFAMMYRTLHYVLYILVPVVPHKAVAEVSKIGNL